jgi:hypothetical protein
MSYLRTFARRCKSGEGTKRNKRPEKQTRLYFSSLEREDPVLCTVCQKPPVVSQCEFLAGMESATLFGVAGMRIGDGCELGHMLVVRRDALSSWSSIET